MICILFSELGVLILKMLLKEENGSINYKVMSQFLKNTLHLLAVKYSNTSQVGKCFYILSLLNANI